MNKYWGQIWSRALWNFLNPTISREIVHLRLLLRFDQNHNSEIIRLLLKTNFHPVWLQQCSKQLQTIYCNLKCKSFFYSLRREAVLYFPSLLLQSFSSSNMQQVASIISDSAFHPSPSNLPLVHKAAERRRRQAGWGRTAQSGMEMQMKESWGSGSLAENAHPQSSHLHGTTLRNPFLKQSVSQDKTQLLTHTVTKPWFLYSMS